MELKLAIVIAITALSVASCAATREQASRNFDQDSLNCTPGELTQQNALQRRDCINQAFILRSQEARATNMSAVYQTATANKAAAVAYVEGKISKEQYQASVKTNNDNYNLTAQEQPADTASLADAIAAYGQARANSDAARIQSLQNSPQVQTNVYVPPQDNRPHCSQYCQMMIDTGHVTANDPCAVQCAR
jgi:hypothetical protein